MSRADRRLAALLGALVLALTIAALTQRPLFDPDEGRYAEIPREMLASGDFVLPHLDGLEYLEKPPLQYWASAGALALLGRTALAARLYTALCALGTLVVVGFLAHRLYGTAAAMRAICLLGSMVLFVTLGQLLTLDMSLTFWMTLALAGFLLAQRVPDGASETVGSARAAGRWMLVAWAASALGVLTKGLEAVVVPAAVLLLYTLFTRDSRPWRRLSLLPGLALFALIAVPWFVAVTRREPDFPAFFFVHEHAARYLTPSADREEAWWFFGPVLLWGTLPWTLPALRALLTGWRAPRPAGPNTSAFDGRRFLALWVLFVLGFFSLSDSKLIPYLLPALPPLALLAATLPSAPWALDLRRTTALTFAAAALGGVLAIAGPRYLPATPRNACFAALAPALGEAALLLAVAAALALAAQRGGRAAGRAAGGRAAAGSAPAGSTAACSTAAMLLVAAGWWGGALWLARAGDAVAPIYSAFELVRSLPAVPADVPVYSVGTYDQTLPFYWNRTVRLVHYRGELDFGLSHARLPDASLSLPEFVARWRAAPAAYAVMDRGTYETLARDGVPMRERAHDLRHVLVSRS